jgi:replicative DNA helicase
MPFEIGGGQETPKFSRYRRKDAEPLAFQPGEKPHDMSLERSVLAGILLYNDILPDVQQVLRNVSDFYLPAHQEIYEAMGRLAFKNVPIDLGTLMGSLKENGKLDLVGGPAYLAEIAGTSATSAHTLQYAQFVSDLGWRRRLVEACDQGKNSALKAGDTREIASEVEKLVFEATQEKKLTSVTSVSALLPGLIEEFERRADNKGIVDPYVVTTGLTDLDRTLTGFRPGQLIVLAAGPGTGKTALAVNVMHYAAVKQKKNVLFFSLEMTRKEIVERMMSFAARVDAGSLRSGNIRPEDFNDIYHAADELGSANLLLDDRSVVTPFDILGTCRKELARMRMTDPEARIDLVVVDYIQIMKAGGNAENRSIEVAQITGGLKTIAKEMNVPVLALSQLNRARAARTGPGESKRPQLSDLRDSGAIEADADVVLFIHREQGPDTDSRSYAEAEIIVAKHRAGPTGTVKVTWEGHLTRFSNFVSQSSVSSNYGDIAGPADYGP